MVIQSVEAVKVIRASEKIGIIARLVADIPGGVDVVILAADLSDVPSVIAAVSIAGNDAAGYSGVHQKPVCQLSDTLAYGPSVDQC